MSHIRNLMVFLALLFPGSANSESTCFGSTSTGRIANACLLPSNGESFSSYSTVARLLGRTWVHCKVHDVLLMAYQHIAQSNPQKRLAPMQPRTIIGLCFAFLLSCGEPPTVPAHSDFNIGASRAQVLRKHGEPPRTTVFHKPMIEFGAL